MPPSRQPAKTLFLWSLVLATPVAALLLIEGAARLFLARPPDDPYLNFTTPVRIFARSTVDGVETIEIVHAEAYRERHLRFPARKPPGTVRVFCVGESANASWPHPVGEAWSDYLREALAAALPAVHVEVFNISGHAWGSYRLRMIVDDLVRFDPDLIVLWIGNNEFLERREYLTSTAEAALRWLAGHSRLVQVARARVLLRVRPENTLPGEARAHQQYGIWSKIHRIALDLRRVPDQFAAVLDHYRYGMNAMVDAARARRVPVVLLTVPVNLRDWEPNVSSNALAGPELAAWQRELDAGLAALYEGRPAEAIPALERAVARDPVSADAQFQLGRAREATGDFAGAREAYRAAKDLDYNPFRALSVMNDALRDLARRRATEIHLVDAERIVEAGARNGIPGFDMFLDYVHPTRPANLIIARAVFDAIVSGNLLPARPTSTAFQHANRLTDGRPYDEDHDALLHGVMLQLMMMMHQDESAVAKARYLEGFATPDAARQDIHETAETMSEFVDLRRRDVLRQPVDPAERARIMARYEALYRRKFGAPNYD